MASFLPRGLSPIVLIVLCFCLTALGGCEQATELLQPPPGEEDDEEEGTVERATFAITVVTDGESAEAAAVLGSAPGRLRGAEVRIRRFGESEVRSSVTDSVGQVGFEDLLQGNYEVSVLRLLTDADREKLAELDGELAELSAFGGGGFASVSAPADSSEIEVTAGRRGSLMVSEVYHYIPRSTSNVYRQAQYAEFYNNADTTVYMGGKVLASGLWSPFDRSDGSCSEVDQWRDDPEGMWSNMYLQFPGTDRQYPVAPGEAVVLARDAIDHGAIWEGLPDLSGADFEYVDSNDADNPSVPNVRDIGPYRWVDAAGDGLFLGPVYLALVLSESFDPEQIPHDDLPLSKPEHHRIPADKILDVTALVPTPERQANLTDLCSPLLHPAFDRQPASLFDESSPQAIQRRVLGTTPEGASLLLETNTSANDFERRAPSPGSVP